MENKNSNSSLAALFISIAYALFVFSSGFMFGFMKHKSIVEKAELAKK